MSLYPNPSMHFLNIKLLSLEKSMKIIRIIDLNGRLITEYRPRLVNYFKINTNKFANGMYLLQITTSDNKVLRPKKIIIAK
jgi:hypothetical protein